VPRPSRGLALAAAKRSLTEVQVLSIVTALAGGLLAYPNTVAHKISNLRVLHRVPYTFQCILMSIELLR
jgi:hypothetical protein